MANTKFKFYMLMAVIAAMLLTAFVVINNYVIQKHIAQTESQVQADLLPITNSLTFNLYNNIQVVKGLPALFAINPSLSQQDFIKGAKKIFDGSVQIRNIAVAPDLIIKYMYPVEGNEAAIGIDFRMLPNQLESVNRAIKSKQLILAGPLRLVQGGMGLISRIPVFLENSDGDEFFWGIISAVIDVDSFYKQSGLLDTALPIDIAIRGQDGLGENGAVFFGDPHLFDQKNIASVITVPNGSWLIVASPKGGWKALPDDIWLTRLELAAGALMLFLLLFLFLKTSMKASLANLKFKNLIESSPIPYILMNGKQDVTFVNLAFIKTYGYTVEDISTVEAWRNKAYPNKQYREQIIAAWKAYVKEFWSSNDIVPPLEINIQSKNGATHTALASLTSDRLTTNRGSEYTIVLYDITERKLAEEQSQISKHQLENVIEGAQLGYWDWNYKTGEHIVNARWLSMLGLSDDKLTNTLSDWADHIHPDDKQSVIDTVQAHIKSNEAYVAEFRMKHVDGHWVWIEGAGAVVEYDEATHEPLRLCGTHQDITARKKIEAKLMLSARVFSDTYEGIIITDANNIIIDVNPAYCAITGYELEDVIGKKPNILNSGRQSAAFYEEMWLELQQHGHWQGEVWNRKKGGELYVEFLTISKLLDGHGQVINYIGVFTDITDRKQQQEKLSLMAHYDLLTGLPNRALFTDRFHQAIAHSKRTKAQLAVCFLDLDNFKPVNDNYGHEIGDQLLIQVAARIKASLREEDTVSRQGGDEFAFLLNDIESYEHCEQTLERLHRSLALPYIIDGYAHNISASTGITLFPADNGDIDTLLRHADQAMYQSKQAGRNRYQLFDTQDDQDAVNKHHRLAEIKHGLINNEFTLYYQPKVNMVTGEVFGVEALIRWLHPAKGLIPPLSFLPFIDGTDVEIMIGNWVINQALGQLQDWNQQGIELEVSVNIASHHLRSEPFFSQLSEALAAHSTVNAHSLQLEILESSALGDLDAISNIIKTVQQKLGVNVALDDFGTGYSSLTHLRNLSANTLKIDQSFVRDILEDPSDYAIIEGVIGLANAFNRKVIAEGVESHDHGVMLIMMGCEQAQGYGIAKPMPANDFADWLDHYEPNQEWIHFSKQQRTVKENKVKLFQLVATYWMNRFANNIQASAGDMKDWPLMSGKHDHCGKWLRREQQELLFSHEGLAQLDKVYQEFHQISQSLFLKYQADDIEEAKAGLVEFYTAFDKVLQHAKLLLI
jgi:diguanylate cyclase (GGDEF)-like protein/PAS domain S-box-containing protein